MTLEPNQQYLKELRHSMKIMKKQIENGRKAKQVIEDEDMILKAISSRMD